MGKKGGSRHIKRLSAPTFWPIRVKQFTWATKPKAGPHPLERSMPLSVVVRDVLHLAKTRKEAKMTIARGAVKVDGRIRRNHKYPVGLMDIVEIPDTKSVYRMVPFHAKGLSLLRITKDESGFKLCLIDDKIPLKGGRIQLNLSDGRNIALTQSGATTVDAYETRDTIQLGIPDQKILGHVKFAEGKYGLVVAGRNIGRHGKVVGIEKAKTSRLARVAIQDALGQTFRTVADYVYAVGDDKSMIKLPEE